MCPSVSATGCMWRFTGVCICSPLQLWVPGIKLRSLEDYILAEPHHQAPNKILCDMYFLCGELISPLKNNILGRVFRQQTLVFWSLTTYAQHLFFFPFLVRELTSLTCS